MINCLLAEIKSEKQTNGPMSSALHCFSLTNILKFLTKISLAWSHVVDIFNYEIKKIRKFFKYTKMLELNPYRYIFLIYLKVINIMCKQWACSILEKTKKNKI